MKSSNTDQQKEYYGGSAWLFQKLKKRKPYRTKILVKVKDEVKLVIDATSGYEPYDRQRIIEQNKKNAVRHAYFREYLALQRLCLLILRHQKHQKDFVQAFSLYK